MSTISLSFRTEESTREELDRIASALDRNRNWLINEAIAGYLELHRWQIEHIERGMAENDAGKGYTLAEVRDHFAKRAATDRKKAKAK